ncbi:MAG: rhomboid family intramembrane serine protease [Planctomycetota bacterium]|nr:rhomboid family intramembrane serine protease [Planctomycetota bacterium]
MEQPEEHQSEAAPSRWAPFTYATIAISIVVFVGQLMESDPSSEETLRRWGVLFSWDIYDGAYGSLVTAVFSHLDILHILFNLIFVWILSRPLERTIGGLRWLAFFVAAAWVSSACELAASEGTVMGVSGVIYAMLGFMWVTRRRFPLFQEALTRKVVGILLVSAILCVWVAEAAVMDIANVAHISGLAFGALVGGALLPRARGASIAAASLLTIAATATLFWAPWSPTWVGLKAWYAHGEDRYDEALRLYRRSIELEPDDPDWALVRIAVIEGGRHKENEEYELAIERFSEAIRLEPKHLWAYNQRGQARRWAGHYEDAIEDFTTAIRLDATDPFAFDERGRAQSSLENYKAAIADFTKALEFDPEFHWSYAGRGDARMEKGDLDGAIKDLTKAIELDPEYEWAYTIRGMARRKNGDFGDAIEDFNQSIRLDPTDPWSYDRRARVYGDLGKHKGAIIDFTKAIEVDAEYEWSYLGRAEARLKIGELDGAIADCTRAIRLDSEWPYAHVVRGRVLEAKGNVEDAIEDYERAIEIQPDYGTAHYYLGFALSQDDEEGALAAFERAMEHGQRVPEVLNSTAWVLCTSADPELRDPAKAVELALEAFKAEPKDAATMDTLGTALYRLGKSQAALEALEKAMAMRSEDAEVSAFFRAMVHWQLGQKDEARRWYERGVAWQEKHRPDDEEQKRFRAEAAELLGVTAKAPAEAGR